MGKEAGDDKKRGTNSTARAVLHSLTLAGKRKLFWSHIHDLARVLGVHARGRDFEETECLDRLKHIG